MQIPLEKKLELDRLIEQQDRQRAEAARRKAKRAAGAARRRHRNRLALIIAICILWLLALTALGLRLHDPLPQATTTPPVIADKLSAVKAAEDAEEPERIEAALEAQGYFRADIPLTYEEQDYLQTACEEFEVPYALALAVIQQETDFRNVMGDDGQSAGYMQIQARWHRDRMAELGVTDLMDPYSNFRVGCSFLSELISRYDLTDALTYYNSGHTGSSGYAESVIRFMDNYQEGVKPS